MNAIFTRRSVRKFQDKPIEQDKIEKLLRAGMCSPTAGNQREWEFIVIQNKSVLEKLSTASPYAKSLLTANLAVVPVYRPAICRYPNNIQQDMGACTQTILLEAEALSLGAVWLGVDPVPERMNAVTEILQIPEGFIPFAMIAIGYPDETPAERERFDPAKIHYEKF